MTLPDETIVYPAHGAGSSCGKNMSKETFDTLGHQKQVNYALRPGLSKDQFIAELTCGIMPPPQYFAKNAALNKQGYQSIEIVLKAADKQLSVADFKTEMTKGAYVMDVRHQQEFAKGFIPGSAFFGLDGTFAIWVGTLLENINTPILLVTPPGREQEAVTRLARVGYDNVVGVLSGGFDSWKNAGEPIDTITSISAETFAERFTNGEINVLDVRKPSEYESGHLPNVENKPLDFYLNQWSHIPQGKPYFIHCAGGYRSMIYASLLRKAGYQDLIDVDGGFGKIKTTGLEIVTEQLA